MSGCFVVSGDHLIVAHGCFGSALVKVHVRLVEKYVLAAQHCVESVLQLRLHVNRVGFVVVMVVHG